MDWVLRGLGLFYALSGFLYARSFARDGVLAKALHQLGEKSTEAERVRSYQLRAMAALTVASGLALLTLSRWAPHLMIANAILQAMWLVYSRQAFPPRDTDEALGRKRTTNAFVIWLIVTVLTCTVLWGGYATPVTEGAASWMPIFGGAIFLAWMVIQ